MKRGEKNRIIRSTSMNAKSSRSHTIFQVQIEASRADESGSLKRSKINLCDLAGSEKANRGENLKKAHLTEMISINQSLTTLGTNVGYSRQGHIESLLKQLKKKSPSHPVQRKQTDQVTSR